MRPFYVRHARLTIDLDNVGAISDLEGSGQYRQFHIHIQGGMLTVESFGGDLPEAYEALMSAWIEGGR